MATQLTLNVASGGVETAKELATGTAEGVAQLTAAATDEAAAVSNKIKQTTLAPSATVKKAAEGADTVEFAVWAQPPEDQLIVLECIVNELAVNADVPAYKPHVTLWRAVMPADTDPDRLIAEVENAINEWRATEKGKAELHCLFKGVEERRGSLVALLEPTDQLRDLHAWIHTSVEGLVMLEKNVFQPHVTLLHETDDGKPVEHLALLAEKGWLDNVDSALLQVDGFIADKLFFAQSAEGEEPGLWLALREFAL